MAIPALKCPYLAQLTLQQVRAAAPHILNAGAESCPIFGQFVRKISTTGAHFPSTNLSFDEIKAVHEQILGQKTSKKIQIPTTINKTLYPYSESKNRSF
jgi:hypothetical protein